ncbi:hypothetical protein Pan181_16110 [Aeoliella mucimassa]|uniref:Uncharacterized protein n=2 Tax=Aeoliella mucimassa TaxID=2527972 RepID=A0A518AL09_9BACT|nr:hypothetical protein Pan181_16110 [Aeoliella mucimassa]
MILPRFRNAMLLAAVLMVSSTGCQMYRPPGAMLPSLAAAKQDREIEKFAETSSFPTPEQVGLTDEDE